MGTMHKKITATYLECYFSPRKFETVQNPHLSEFCILYTVPLSLVLMNMQVVTFSGPPWPCFGSLVQSGQFAVEWIRHGAVSKVARVSGAGAELA